jgi:hypothetical protein
MLGGFSPIVTQMVSAERAAALRNKCLNLAKTCSFGFRSGEYFGRKRAWARLRG